jgi:hypothetical protein
LKLSARDIFRKNIELWWGDFYATELNAPAHPPEKKLLNPPYRGPRHPVMTPPEQRSLGSSHPMAPAVRKSSMEHLHAQLRMHYQWFDGTIPYLRPLFAGG